ncbi:hypothetical protein, partial [Staphylococcus aureus]|uniref:hypothetical protein n=1 Tax=Staphylococcus aureus TaxID=1280 RepID=UPI000AA253F6
MGNFLLDYSLWYVFQLDKNRTDINYKSYQILFLSIKRIKYLLDKEENRHKVEINKIKTNIF